MCARWWSWTRQATPEKCSINFDSLRVKMTDELLPEPLRYQEEARPLYDDPYFHIVIVRSSMIGLDPFIELLDYIVRGCDGKDREVDS